MFWLYSWKLIRNRYAKDCLLIVTYLNWFNKINCRHLIWNGFWTGVRFPPPPPNLRVKMDVIKKNWWNQHFLRYFKESKNSDLRGCTLYKRVSPPKNRYFLLQRWGKMKTGNQMKFYLNTHNLQETVFLIFPLLFF